MRKQYRYDAKHSVNEDRYQIIGQIEFDIVLAIYTERDYSDGEETICIISARVAKPYEERAYYQRTFALGGNYDG